MTKTKLKQIALDTLQQFIEENREDILESIQSEAYVVDEDGETVQVDIEVIEEAYDTIISSLF